MEKILSRIKNLMKKLLGIVVLGLLFFSNANAIPKWIGKAIKVCRATATSCRRYS